jgi:adenosine deaminase
MRARELQNLRALLLAIPKTEIHLHLEALATVDTIWALMKKHDITLSDVDTKDDLRRKFQITSLNEMIDIFINVIQNCFRNDEDIALLIDDACEYLKRNNIIYAEIFFSPSMFIKNGLSFESMIGILNAGIQDLKKKENIEIKLIIDISRTFGVKNAENNLNLTLSNPVDSVIGIGLGGAEEQGPAEKFKKIFAKAIKNDLHVVAHAGEVVGPESIWSALRNLNAERIGHGISAIQDDKLMDELREKRIPLEICPTSNLFTQKYVKQLEEHPIRAFYDRDLLITVNTDDPTLFGIDLIDEYMKLTNKGFFEPAEIIMLVKNNLYSSFLPQDSKDQIWSSAENIIKKYEKKISLR